MDAPLPSPYVIRFEEIFWGGMLVAVTMIIHGSGMGEAPLQADCSSFSSAGRCGPTGGRRLAGKKL